MQTQPTFGFTQLLTHIVGAVSKAVSERDGETKQQQFDRSQAAVHLILGLLPRDAAEAVLAGHCVMFHAVMIENAREILRGEPAGTRRGMGGTLIASNRAFSGNLDRLWKLQTRRSESDRDMAETTMEPEAGTVATDATNEDAMPTQLTMQAAPARMNRAARRQATRDQRRANRGRVNATESPAAVGKPGPVAGAQPPIAERPSTADKAALIRANPAAAAAIEAGDALGFARAMGIDKPAAEFLAAAARPGSPFDREASGPWPDAYPSAGED